MKKSARTRQRILDAAAAVFREHGYANARLSDIAARAGIQTGSLYYHFTSREELVAEILRLGVATAWGQVRVAVDALPRDTSPIERLAVAIRVHTMAVLEIDDYASAQARIVGQVPPAIAVVHRDDRRAYGEYWHGLLVDAQRAGLLADGLDLFTARMLCIGAMNWTGEWFDSRHGTAVEVADQAAVQLLAGLTGSADAVP